MQRVRIQDPNGQWLEFTTDKNEFGEPATGYVFNTIYGVGKPSVEISETRGVEQEGATYQRSHLNPRDIDLNLYAYGSDQHAMYQRLVEISRAVSKPNQRIEYINDYAGWFIYGTVTSVEYSARMAVRGQIKPIRMTIHCSDPFWRLLSDEPEGTLYYRAGKFKFPFMIRPPGVQFGGGGYRQELNNQGTHETPAEIWIRGQAVNPVIQNVTTGFYLQLTINTTPFETIYINTARGKQTIELRNTSTGEKQIRRDILNRYVNSTLDPKIRYWGLVPGMNDVIYTSDADVQTTLVTMRWASLFSGV